MSGDGQDMPKHMSKLIIFALSAIIFLYIGFYIYKEYEKFKLAQYEEDRINKVEVLVKYGTSYCNNPNQVMFAIKNNSDEDISSYYVDYLIQDKTDSSVELRGKKYFTKVVKTKESSHTCHDIIDNIYSGSMYSLNNNTNIDDLIIKSQIVNAKFGPHYWYE